MRRSAKLIVDQHQLIDSNRLLLLLLLRLDDFTQIQSARTEPREAAHCAARHTIVAAVLRIYQHALVVDLNYFARTLRTQRVHLTFCPSNCNQYQTGDSPLLQSVLRASI